MFIDWNNEKTFKWFLSAVEYTGYTDNMAALLLERLPSGGTLYDLGCGMGLIDLKLHPHFSNITCVDVSESSIKWLESEICRQNIKNITPVCTDAHLLKEPKDCVIALFHSNAYDVLKYYLPLTKDTLVLVTHPRILDSPVEVKNKFRENANVTAAVNAFDEAQIKYDLFEGSLEYGQPLKSEEDGLQFIKAYRKNAPSETPEEYLKQNVIETGNKNYPLYLPSLKKFGIFTIKKQPRISAGLLFTHLLKIITFVNF